MWFFLLSDAEYRRDAEVADRHSDTPKDYLLHESAAHSANKDSLMSGGYWPGDSDLLIIAVTGPGLSAPSGNHAEIKTCVAGPHGITDSSSASSAERARSVPKRYL